MRGFLYSLACLLLLPALPAAAQGCREGYAQVPCGPAGLRTVVVAQDGSGQYTSIQAALDAAQPGDDIRVKAGIYAESLNLHVPGTPALPISLLAWPGDTPTVRPGGLYGNSVNIRAEWVIVQGFEIEGGYDGLTLYEGHAVVRQNYIHGSGDQSPVQNASGNGILLVSCEHVLLEGNLLAHNGDVQQVLPGPHGIYLSDFDHTGIRNITLRGNVIRAHQGAGIHVFIGTGVNDSLLLENNVLENNTHELILVNTTHSLVRNNTVIHHTHPVTPFTYSTLIWLELVSDLRVYNNVFATTLTDSAAGVFRPGGAAAAVVFDYNLWHTAPGVLLEYNNPAAPFNTWYQTATGFDANGPPIPSDPLFAGVGDYALTAGSPARNAGNNAYAAATDHLGLPRPQELVADIGAYEYPVPAAAEGARDAASLILLPCPAQDRVWLDGSLQVDAVQIQALDGRCVYATACALPCALKLPPLPAGLYLLTAYQDALPVAVRRFQVQP